MRKKKKNFFKKKSFYFEDYSESELVSNKNKNSVIISLNRVTFLFFIFVSLILIFSIKITYLSLVPQKNFFTSVDKKSFFAYAVIKNQLCCVHDL